MSHPPTSADIVVIGAGPAGCLLAERLSAGGERSVVLIEAGTGTTPKEARIPAAFPKLFKGPLDWGYQTAPQAGLGGRELFWPRGRALGGSATINAQVWTHADPADLADWAGVAPDTFSPAAVTAARARVDREQQPEPLRDPNELTSAFVSTAAAGGLRATKDANDVLGGDRVAPVTASQRRGLRRSPRHVYLDPAMGRPNLTVLTDALVQRIDIRRGRMSGVTFVVGGQRRTIATDAVVLAAGAIGSPQLLQLSGIGDVNHLRRVGIEVVHGLPAVGAHLQDHLMAVSIAATTGEVRTLKDAERIRELLSLLIRRRGMLTSNVAEAVAFLRTQVDLAAPDVELVFAPVMFIEHGFVAPHAHGVSIGAVLLTPQSEGAVRVRSADPSAAPIIDPAYLSDPAGHDLATLALGVGRSLDFFGRGPLSAHVRTLHQPVGTARDEVERFIRERSETIYHPTGTCRMGNDGGTDSVVDANFAVHGIDGLWVADASVMPTIPRCHPTAPTLMLADLAAQSITNPSARTSASLAMDGVR
jgi:choline dehydrogenase